MIMKQMPYKIPDDFFEKSKSANRAAIRMTKSGTGSGRKISQWAVSLAATAACFAICIAAYSGLMHGGDSEFDELIAQMENASDELIYEISSDAVEYPEDINYL